MEAGLNSHTPLAHGVSPRADVRGCLRPGAFRLRMMERMLRRGPATMARIRAFTGASAPTFKRDLDLLRNCGAVIAYEQAEGYRLKNPDWPGIVPSLMQAVDGRWPA